MRREPVVVALAGQPDDGSPGQLGQLDGDRSHAAGGARDYDRVSRAGRDGPHGGVGGRADDEQRAGHLPRHCIRLRRQVICLDQHVLRVARPVVGVADDILAQRQSDRASPEGGDDSGQVAALAGGERRRESLMQQAVADLRLAWIDARRPDLHQHLPWPRHGRRHLLDVQDVDSAVLREPHCLHRDTPVSHRVCLSASSTPQPPAVASYAAD